MRGGLERWKRGVESHGVRAAIAYALDGNCDAATRIASGVDALAQYSDAATRKVARFTVEHGTISVDQLGREQLCSWVDGRDPRTGERRGRDLVSPDADLILDGTINAPKSYSLVALLNPNLATEYEALQDRLRDRIICTWQSELNARRGAGGRFREELAQIEVVELQHRRSRALDPHIHRHLWLSVKVRGEDGQWSNVDSRVAMKLHTLINAEGELAARTDPQWIAALAAHGYTLNADGEVAQVAHAVRPLSRRSNQIEANRAVMIAEWRQAHVGREPDREVLNQIDRRAWATDRPRKPKELEEAEWELLIREELEKIDPELGRDRAAVAPRVTRLEQLDLRLLAARAIVDADLRSTGYGGRFSSFDVRAGAMRAVAASGIVAGRGELDSVIEQVVENAFAHTIDLLDGDAERPAHIKGYMAESTAALKAELADRFDALNAAGDALSSEAMSLIADAELASGDTMDAAQAQAAGAIAGTDRLVAVTGPAGTGKTTMLRVAKRALSMQGRRLIVVAPTKKAASVAGREIGSMAFSIHALLADHGWRWGRDDAGAEIWTRLERGVADASTGILYSGPARYLVRTGDRIVVDEAGMVDLHTANALAQLAAETGAGIAMVGDHLQAMPVGHSGAMACMTRRSGSVVELTTVHRFDDPDYAELSLRLREPGSMDAALSVAQALATRGQVHRVDDLVAARELMMAAYFRYATGSRRVALVTSTNDEADAINEAIQQRRVDIGELNLRRVAVGRGEQRILCGDVVQTRRNDRKADVENRALWKVKRITAAGLELVSLTDSGDVRQVSTDYVSEHVQLAYASTVHGIQGETTHVSVVGPGVDASGLYVGMTRGRDHNEAIAIARSDADAVEVIASAMLRGISEVTIDDSRHAALVELGRAARTVPLVNGDESRWNDRRARPFGATSNLERAKARLTHELSEARKAADALAEWVGSAQKVMTSAARSDAALHARVRDVGGHQVRDGRMADLGTRLLEREENFDAWQDEIVRLRQLLILVDDESNTRSSMGTVAKAREEAERAAAERIVVAPTGSSLALS